MTDSPASASRKSPLCGLFVVAALALMPAAARAEKPVWANSAGISAPLEVYARLPELRMGPVPPLSADERAFLTRVCKQKADKRIAVVRLDQSALLEALLWASGIEDAPARQRYREQFRGLLAKTREAVRDAKNSRERGERLMRYVHRSVLHGGYQAEQTSFATILDSGKFNCVSSTALYYLLGSHLGLELRAISIPGEWPLAGHASLDMIENGRRIQIEPTNPDGFDWQSKSQRPGVTMVGFVPDRKKGHEVDAPGIAAMIYTNRGVALSRHKARLQAVRCYLAALALDPADETSAHNLLAIFVNWGPELARDKQFEEAVRVLGFGLSLAPQSDELHTNYSNAWSRYIMHTLKSGKDIEAVALMRRAAVAEPNGKDFQGGAVWFMRLGEQRIKQRKTFEAGLAVAQRGLRLLPVKDCKELRQWQSTLFRRWSQDLLDKQDPDGSLKVLARAYALDPQDREIINGIAYHAQKSLQMLESQGLPALVAHFRALRGQFPKVDEVAESGKWHAARRIQQLSAQKRFKEAVEAVERYQPLFATAKQYAEVGGDAYDLWALHLAGQQQWEAALRKYGEGLKAFPKQQRLLNNAEATVDQWAHAAIRAAKWDEAIRIYTTGLQINGLHNSKHLQENRKFCEDKKAK